MRTLSLCPPDQLVTNQNVLLIKTELIYVGNTKDMNIMKCAHMLPNEIMDTSTFA